ncbi:MAG TPA: hypothetical protein VK804_27005 [Bradyrhizobium sp.]|jgi:hypothetical protein|uniref:hypothetical protein n=1 Tax=Bradyrhizobium sp. TaxID=376 RepID=UPI002CB8E717|nr:hypothetical protein [Bradyrhizobium sp.]HTB04132.1 hypothetical protein [Bradyrhizobium sp.]
MVTKRAKPARPSKPDHVEAAPRYKTRSKGPAKTGMETALKAVRSLIHSEMSIEHATAFIEEVKRERNDRGAAILAATNTENALRHVIARRLAVTRSDYDNLFGLNGPMGTFDLKIRMAFALKIFGKETNDNLILVRTIRNAFAHASIPITFDTVEIRELCRLLVIPFVLFPKQIKVVDGKVIDLDEPMEARARFNTTCESLTHNFIIFAGHCFQKPKKHSDWNKYDAWLTLPPLP